MFRSTAFLLANLVIASASAGVCRWTDSDGQVHYGEQPPAGVACERHVRVPPPGSHPDALRTAQGPDYAVLENEFQRRRLARLEASLREEEEKLMRERRAEACGQARGRFNWLQAGGRAMVASSDGERHYVDEVERANEIAVAQQKVAYYCR